MIKRNNKFKIIIFVLVLLLLVFSLLMVYFERVVLPRGAEILHSYAETNMFEILNSTISEVIEKHSLNYESLVDIKYSSDGEISLVSVDYKMVNIIKSD